MATNYDSREENESDLYQSETGPTPKAGSSAIPGIGGLVASQATSDRDPVDKAHDKRVTVESERDGRRNAGAVEGGVGSGTSGRREQAATVVAADATEPNNGVRSG